MDWDKRKARDNERKHGVRFTDVEPVFYDDQALTVEDKSAEGEQRLKTLGMDGFGRILVVTYTMRADEIRLISARKASAGEARIYEQR